METDELIDRLVAGHRSVDGRWIERATAISAVLTVALVAGLIAISIGLRSGTALYDALRDGHLAEKYLFMLSALAVSGLVFVRLARPGSRLVDLAPVYLLPPALMLAAGAIDLVAGTTGFTRPVVLGTTNWIACLAYVPVFALVPYAALIMVLRRAAPTDRKGAGWAAGIFATSIASMAYAAHCPCDSPLFVVVWYPLAFACGGWAGARLTPRLVRW